MNVYSPGNFNQARNWQVLGETPLMHPSMPRCCISDVVFKFLTLSDAQIQHVCKDCCEP